ncbi:MAG: phage major capsid protein [Oscillospiraceae bacterium]
MNYFENVTLDKNMYHTQKSFCNALETADPSSNYKGSELFKLDAYERQLKRFDIKVRGENSDTVSKFFQTTESATLFPEFVKRSILSGLNEENILNDIIATKTMVNSLDYRAISAADSIAQLTSDVITNTSPIPVTLITSKTNLAVLKKRGRIVSMAYETIQFQRLDVLALTLKQIGIYIAKSQLSDAVSILVNGDGNLNDAMETSVAANNVLTYSDLIKLWSGFDQFSLNRMLVATDVMDKLLKMPEVLNADGGFVFDGCSKILTPMGAVIYRCSDVPTGTIIGLDKNYALEMICAGDVKLETDKLIDKQLERVAITSIAGFTKIFSGATQILRVTAKV